MNKYIKMTAQSFDEVGRMLNDLQIASGIQNATNFVKIIQLLNQVEIKEEEIVEGE